MNSETIGGLSHLVEAATALSKLVDANAPASALPASNVPPLQRSIVSDDDEEARRRSKLTPAPASPREIFPQRLLQILEDTSLSDVISWLPHGRSFVIIRPDVFSERVLPQYFPSTDSRSSTKYPSFTRKLNRWGFRQATRGPDTGAFHHPLFRRNEPQLCLDMVCQKSRKRGSTKGTKNKNNDTVEGVSNPNASKAPCESNKSVAAESSKNHPLTKEALATLPTSEPQNPGRTVSNISMDDRSVSSTAPVPAQLPNTAILNNNNQFSSNAVVTQPLSPWVPSDPKLVAATLRAQEEREKLTVAKSFLYEAYLKALRG